MEEATVITKKELRQKLEVSQRTLSRWLNYRYYAELQKRGYYRNQKILTPSQYSVVKDLLVIND